MNQAVLAGNHSNELNDLAKSKLSWRAMIFWMILFSVLWASWGGAEMRPGDLIKDSGNMVTLLGDFFPPNFTDWRLYMDEMLITVKIAVWGTALAVVSAVPFGLMSSSNLFPAWVYQPTRRFMDAFRAVNEMVFAMLFVVAVGLGPFAGVLALWVNTTGVLAKLFSEAVEAIDPQPVEGIRATGASSWHEIVFGVIPQVLPLWVSFALYRFESNVRSATVVGMVGAGGIGVVLWEIIRSFRYQETAAIIILIVVAVSLIDMVSSRIRSWLV